MGAYGNPADVRAYKKRKVVCVAVEEVDCVIRIACTGSIFLYHTGFIALDAERNDKIAKVRDRIMELVALGRVSLSQKKLAEYSYEYYAKVL